MKKKYTWILGLAALLAFANSAAAQTAWPAVNSSVAIVLRPSGANYLPVKFDYKLSHLGVMMYQGSIPLTPSHHSLIAAGAQYQADENAACATAEQILPNPSGAAIQVARMNYYFIPPSTRIVINKTMYDCP